VPTTTNSSLSLRPSPSPSPDCRTVTSLPRCPFSTMIPVPCGLVLHRVLARESHFFSSTGYSLSPWLNHVATVGSARREEVGEAEERRVGGSSLVQSHRYLVIQVKALLVCVVAKAQYGQTLPLRCPILNLRRKGCTVLPHSKLQEDAKELPSSMRFI
jgi:hypothetical protein